MKLRLPHFLALVAPVLLAACGGGPATSLDERAAASSAVTEPGEDSVNPGINETFLDPGLDVQEFVDKFEVESREIWVERKAIAARVGLEPGMEVADVGAGTGLFEPLFSEAVGSQGAVYAVDLSPGMLEHLRERRREEDWGNVVVHPCTERSVEMPAGSVDRVFICDTYHHFEYPRSTMSSIHRALREDGEVVIVDFERIEGESRPWILDHVRCGKETVLEELDSFGFELIEEVELDGLEENYLLRLRKK